MEKKCDRFLEPHSDLESRGSWAFEGFEVGDGQL